MSRFSLNSRAKLVTAIGALCLMTTGAQAQNLVVDGSLCVGNDCPTSPAFGFATILLQENNLRIKALDTSTSASFPTTDWQITFNESANGGRNKFSIVDLDSDRTPFTIEARARNHSLYVDDGGRIGIGTSTPVADLHAKTGNTPTLRLEQDGASGFTSQIWDVAGNEAGFFIRDVTGGSTLPFRIRPGAANASLVIDGDDEVGISVGTNPRAKLHISNGGAVQPAPNAEDDMIIQDDGPVRFALINLSPVGGANEIWTFTNNNTMRLSAGTDDPEFILDDSGNLTILGALTESSDKHAKMAIEPVSPDEILAKVTALPIAEWTYKHDAEAGTRHIGPMAQDFYAAFGTGADERGISTLDSAGVALAAIQALAAENAEQRAENAEQRALNAQLMERLEALEQQLN